MYSYYFLASAIGKDKEKRQRYLWWGGYLTLFQMFQFVTMMLQVCLLAAARVSFYPVLLTRYQRAALQYK
jgi:hypothetical protein